MAKPTLSKLKLTPKDPVKTLIWNEQEIEIKSYLSIEKKLELITEVLNLAADENRFYNPGKVDMYFHLKVIEYYTNLSITDKQKENIVKLYDDFISSGFYHAVFTAIPESDIGYTYTLLKETIEQFYKYQNSAYGILDSLNTDYKNLDLDVQKIVGELNQGKGVEFLNEVVTKLG